MKISNQSILVRGFAAAMAAIALLPSQSQALVVGRPITWIAPGIPTATDGSARTKPNRTVFITLNANAVGHEMLNYSIVTLPRHGQLHDQGFIAYTQDGSQVGGADMLTTGPQTGGPAMGTPDMSITIALPPSSFFGSQYQSYTPNKDFVGTDSFTFKATNSAGVSNTATVTVTVTNDNIAPVATAQALSVKWGNKLWIYLAGTDADQDFLNYAIATQPTKGILRIPNGSDYGQIVVPMGSIDFPGGGIHPFDPIPGVFIYEPGTCICPATDSFTFTASDATTTSPAETVTITIRGANSAPGPVLALTPAVDAWTKDGILTIIANNNKTAEVVLDASESTDADGDMLWASWFKRTVKGKPAPNVRLAATEEAIAWGLIANTQLKVGNHTIVGKVSDGEAESENSFQVKVITPNEALSRLGMALRNMRSTAASRGKLVVPLGRAAELCRKGNFAKAAEQMTAFNALVMTNLGTKNPTEAAKLIDLGSAIMEALVPTVTIPIRIQ
jgi:Bacterial Ig domain